MMAAIVVCASAVACLLAAERADSRFVRVVSKMSAATAFIAMALASGALESLFGQILLGGLALCWIGDACLLSPGKSIGFLVGIGAFLLAHLAYAIAFYQLGLDPIGLALGGAVVVGLAVVALRWLGPKLPGDFRVPILCYLGVISLMVAVSIGAVAAGASLSLAIAAIVFALSDLFVARERFVTTGFVNSAIGLPAYFGSQLLLAHSASFAVPA